jgi:hypothetical protein
MRLPSQRTPHLRPLMEIVICLLIAGLLPIVVELLAWLVTR